MISRTWTWSVLLMVTVLFLYYQLISTTRNVPAPVHNLQPGHSTSSSEPSCINIWRDLDDEEVVSVLALLHSPAAGLNLTSVKESTFSDNFVFVTELLRPNKTDSVAFLDHQTAPPDRYARVTIKRNSAEVARIEEYMVGPLPVSYTTVIQPLSFIYNSGRSETPFLGADVTALEGWMESIAESMEDVVLDLLLHGVPIPHHLTLKDFVAASNDQIWFEEGRAMRWVSFSQISDANTLLPQGLYFKADTTGRDPEKWRVVMWLYNDIVYASGEELRNAWRSPDFVKLPGNLDGDWTRLEPEQHMNNQYSHNEPPKLTQTGKGRVEVDKKNSFASWMGFEFYLSFSQVTALSLYDIRLDGERVMYELGIQEAVAHYAGNDPVQSGTSFLDSLFALGGDVTELIPGFDCPSYATFLDTKHHRMEKTFHYKNAICIFEAPSDHPLQRHSRGSWVTSFSNSVLIVRYITVVGNYDYLIDYIFYLDGSIEGAYWSNNKRYGYHVHDFLSSSIHDHILNFKADLDIAGSKNTIAVVSVAPKEVDYPWSSKPRNTMVLEKSHIFTEDEASLNWPANGASMYVIMNHQEKNAYGESRGYRIMPGTGMGSPVHLTVKNSSNLLNSAKWTEHDFFVTKQKDTEPRSASPQNALTPEDPLVRFDSFLDGESLVEEDLVIWFNLGNHHVPHSGDIPNTLMTTSASSVMFSPHNYHNRDRSRALTKGVRIDLKEEGFLDSEEELVQ
ncbi:amine oxidase catalytic domain-containing protein [Mollisia scopiformis]|uniref:Amine oxidase n=1 Tax=Mollisia scopiformis TaxID=149040 RepID=A0A194XWI8_MOLSC|nr:amine oxidase catalytic domain-containing protein [Mollisia scopiformis]KUJ24496.1 amine oxidase catalytic domain-containing protein [Mollisia scopiformis]